MRRLITAALGCLLLVVTAANPAGATVHNHNGPWAGYLADTDGSSMPDGFSGVHTTFDFPVTDCSGANANKKIRIAIGFDGSVANGGQDGEQVYADSSCVSGVQEASQWHYCLSDSGHGCFAVANEHTMLTYEDVQPGNNYTVTVCAPHMGCNPGFDDPYYFFTVVDNTDSASHTSIANPSVEGCSFCTNATAGIEVHPQNDGPAKTQPITSSTPFKFVNSQATFGQIEAAKWEGLKSLTWTDTERSDMYDSASPANLCMQTDNWIGSTDTFFEEWEGATCP